MSTMQPSDPLRNLLSNLAKGYTGREFELLFSDQPAIEPNGERIHIWPNPSDVLDLDLSGPNEFRVVRDSLNHECAHYRHSDLHAKRRFAARYDHDTNRQIAAQVWNILEDAYIDSRRLARHPGLRFAHALFVESQLDADDADVSEMTTANALVTVVHHLGLAGRVVGVRDASDTVREFAAWCKPHVEAVRMTDDAHEREHVMARVVDRLLDVLPADPDDALNDIRDATSGSFDPEDAEAVDPTEADPEQAPEDLPSMTDPWADEDEDEREADADATGDGNDGDDVDNGDNGDESEGDGAEDGDGTESDESAGESADDDEGDDSGGAGDEAAEDEQNDDDSAGGGDEPADGDNAADEPGEQGDPDGKPDPSDEGGREPDHGADPEALDAHLDDLDERDERGETPEWHGLDRDADYAEPSRADERRYQRVEDTRKERNETEMGTRRARRDDRITGNSLGAGDASADRVRELLRETGLGEEVRRAFERFATNDVTVRREDGDRLNTAAAVRHVAGDYSETQVYEEDYTAATGGRTISVALDLSGSMRQEGHLGTGAIVDAKVALGAIHIAAAQLGDNLTVSGFWTPGHAGETPLVTGPEETFEWDHLDAVTHGGRQTTTPTAHGVLDAYDLAEAGGGEERIVIVLTDGLPKDGHPDCTGLDYAEEAGHAVRMAREDDVAVIGLGVGLMVESYEHKMRTMFGANYTLTRSENLVEELVEIYADELDYDRPSGY